MSGPQRTTIIGWQGVSARVPAEWTLGAVGGDKKAGYFRVDDDRMPRLQVKWSRGRIDLERKRREYVKRLTRKGRWRKRPTGLEVTTDLRVVSRRSKPKKELVGYGWRGPHCGMGVLWNCEVCKRALIAQVSWTPDQEGHELAKEVLESLEDHAVGGWDTWGVDGLAFLAPEKHELEGWKRMTRYLEVTLGQGAAKLKVARWGMVPLVLGGGRDGETLAVKQWWEGQNRGRRGMRWEAEEAEIKGHEGVIARGRRAGLVQGVKSIGMWLARRRRANRLEAWAWHCPESNRLYLVESAHAPGEDVAKGVVESITCHEED